MKSLIVGLTLMAASTVWAQPDPRDSVIIESKTTPQVSGPCASAVLKVRVYVTNKDSLGNISLVLYPVTTSGTAYAKLSRPPHCGSRTFASVADFLYPPGPNGRPRLPQRLTGWVYNPPFPLPDDILLSLTFDPLDDDSKFPPNLTRAPFIDLKFDSVKGLGTMDIDTARTVESAQITQFVTTVGIGVFVNFAKGIITITPKGDLNLDGILTAADVVLLLNCAFCSETPCEPPSGNRYVCDMNCDGVATAVDVVLLLNVVFLGNSFPC